MYQSLCKVACLSLRYRSANETVRRLCSAAAAATNDTSCDTFEGVIKYWSKKFEDAGVPEPVGSIEHILGHVVGTKKILDLASSLGRKLTAEEGNKLESLCECRLARMPVQYIIGEWDFRELTLKMEPPIFIPRPETEFFIDFIVKRLSEQEETCSRILEIGTGSGAIALALAHASPKVECIAIDQNPHACHLAKRNCLSLNLEDKIAIVHAELMASGDIKDMSGESIIDFDREKFDFIVSNPPYIPTKNIMQLEPEIKVFEDIRALDGGPDGLKVIKPILKYAAKALKPGGHLFLEIDSSHAKYIKFFTEKFQDLNLRFEHIYKDFCNNDRFIEITKFN